MCCSVGTASRIFSVINIFLTQICWSIFLLICGTNVLIMFCSWKFVWINVIGLTKREFKTSNCNCSCNWRLCQSWDQSEIECLSTKPFARIPVQQKLIMTNCTLLPDSACWTLRLQSHCICSNHTALGDYNTQSKATEDWQGQGCCQVFTPNLDNVPDILHKIFF